MYYDAISFPRLGLSADPSNVAFSIGGFKIYWYGVIIAIGFLIAVLYALRRGKEFGLTQDNILDMLFIVAPFSVICARMYYVIFKWDIYFGASATKAFYDIRDGGLAIYGGVIGAVVMLLILAKVKKQKVLPYLDVTSLGLLIGQFIGRWGNFFNREAFGSYSDGLFAMRLSLADAATKIDNTATLDKLKALAAKGGYEGFVQVHPTFLYESVWNLVGFVLLHFLSKRRKYDGQVFLLYLAWYGLGRMWIEALRTDSLMIGPFRVSQLLAMACVVVAGTLLLYFWRKPISPERMYVNQLAHRQAEAMPEDIPVETEVVFESEEDSNGTETDSTDPS